MDQETNEQDEKDEDCQPDPLKRLDKDIEILKRAKEMVEDPMNLRGSGQPYYESGTDSPEEDDQQIAPG